jgi:transcriptional regulator with XRE-family HTH domain
MNRSLNATFAANLKITRIALRWTQHDLSAASGVSQKHISKIERQSTDAPNVRLDLVDVLALALGKNPVALLTRQQNG